MCLTAVIALDFGVLLLSSTAVVFGQLPLCLDSCRIGLLTLCWAFCHVWSVVVFGQLSLCLVSCRGIWSSVVLDCFRCAGLSVVFGSCYCL